jgi:hypothetical protein
MLTNENYFSVENNMKYLSASQFKSFEKCQAAALAETKGEYEREQTNCMLVGSYVDAHFEKSLDLFKAKNPQIFTQKGELKAEFRNAEKIIERLEKDSLFMHYMSGQKQFIKVGKVEGIEFKIKIDSYLPGQCIVDLKVMKDFESIWQDGLKIPFIESWGYDFQAAIYQEIEGNKLPFIIAAATKEKEPNLELFSIPQQRLDYCLDVVRQNAPLYANIKLGLIEPTNCGICDYCKSQKVLTRVIDYTEMETLE